MGRSPGTTASTGRPAHTERARLQGLNNISLLHSRIYLCLLECGAGPQRAVRWLPCVAAVDGAMQVPVGRQSMRVAGSRRPATVRNEALLGGSRSGRGLEARAGRNTRSGLPRPGPPSFTSRIYKLTPPCRRPSCPPRCGRWRAGPHLSHAVDKCTCRSRGLLCPHCRAFPAPVTFAAPQAKPLAPSSQGSRAVAAQARLSGARPAQVARAQRSRAVCSSNAPKASLARSKSADRGSASPTPPCQEQGPVGAGSPGRRA